MHKILITHSLATFVNEDGSVDTVLKTHPGFEDVVKALKNNDVLGAKEATYTKHKATKTKIKGNKIYFDGLELDDIFTESYMIARSEGLSVDKLDLFFSNLKKNPSPISVNAFSSFLGKSRMPITDRGTFLAYKKIRKSDYKDIYSGMFDNRPSCVVAMDRNLVDIVQEHTCSTGFHVCSHDYLDKFGSDHDSECVVVEINPKDVVAVPPDYDLTKMRVASYRVLSTLNFFKKKLLRYEADALGHIPVFNTKVTNGWNVMEDIHLKDKDSRCKTVSVNEWLKSREIAE